MPAKTSSTVTIPDFARWKAEKRKISVLTAYDFTMARLLDASGVDCLLVGDSLGLVVQGRSTTLGVTLDQMVYHVEMVARASERALVVADLPFGSYQSSPQQAIASATRFLKETQCQAVKLEGGRRMAATVKALVDADIPVMAHVGLTPQSIRRLGGFKVQRDEQEILDDARAVTDAGAFAMVLECVPVEIASRVTAEVADPDHRHRRRAALRRPGSGHARPPGPVRRLPAPVRPPIRRAGRADPQGRARLRRRRSGGPVPRPG